MKAGRLIAGGLVATGVIYTVVKLSSVYSAARVATNAMVRIVGIKNIKVGLVGIVPTLKFILQLECTNPTGRQAAFETFALQVKDTASRVGGKMWAQVAYAGPVRMEARELVKIVDIPASVNLGGVALNVLVGPSITTLLNRLSANKNNKKAAETEKPIEGVTERFISLEELQAQQLKGLGANPDQINLLENIKKAIPATLYVIGNVRVNTIPLSIEEKIQIKK